MKRTRSNGDSPSSTTAQSRAPGQARAGGEEPSAPRQPKAPPQHTPQGQQPAQPQDVEAQIRERAYELYQQRAGASGDPIEDWLRAEQLVRGTRPDDGSSIH
jgi:hypothetical protein